MPCSRWCFAHGECEQQSVTRLGRHLRYRLPEDEICQNWGYLGSLRDLFEPTADATLPAYFGVISECFTVDTEYNKLRYEDALLSIRQFHHGHQNFYCDLYTAAHGHRTDQQSSIPPFLPEKYGLPLSTTLGILILFGQPCRNASRLFRLCAEESFAMFYMPETRVYFELGRGTETLAAYSDCGERAHFHADADRQSIQVIERGFRSSCHVRENIHRARYVISMAGVMFNGPALPSFKVNCHNVGFSFGEIGAPQSSA